MTPTLNLALRKLRISDAHIHYDEAYTLYVHFGDRETVGGIEIENTIIVELDKNGEPAGITIASFKTRLLESR